MAFSATVMSSTIPTASGTNSLPNFIQKYWWLRSPWREDRVGVYRVGYDGIVYNAHAYENSYGRRSPGTNYLKWGICINEYGEDAGIFNMNGVESSYGFYGHQFYIR